MYMKKVEDRFWNKVSKTKNCWNWTAATNGHGYGYFRSSSKSNGNTVAHRYSWQLHFGKIPKNMLVCHHCDNPLCVNPKHLFLGTHKTNAIDREKKGRSKIHGVQKLNVKQAREIRHSPLSQIKLAKKFGVSRTTIANIKKGKAWKNA